jgi:hypothetical protein
MARSINTTPSMPDEMGAQPPEFLYLVDVAEDGVVVGYCLRRLARAAKTKLEVVFKRGAVRLWFMGYLLFPRCEGVRRGVFSYRG